MSAPDPLSRKASETSNIVQQSSRFRTTVAFTLLSNAAVKNPDTSTSPSSSTVHSLRCRLLLSYSLSPDAARLRCRCGKGGPQKKDSLRVAKQMQNEYEPVGNERLYRDHRKDVQGYHWSRRLWRRSSSTSSSSSNQEKFTRLGARLPRLSVDRTARYWKNHVSQSSRWRATVPFFSVAVRILLKSTLGSGPQTSRELFEAARRHRLALSLLMRLMPWDSAAMVKAPSARKKTHGEPTVGKSWTAGSEWAVIVFAATNYLRILIRHCSASRFDRKVRSRCRTARTYGPLHALPEYGRHR